MIYILTIMDCYESEYINITSYIDYSIGDVIHYNKRPYIILKIKR